VDGTIAVISPVNTTPTNLTTVVVGNALQITWRLITPAGGWSRRRTRLCRPRHELGDVTGSSATNQMSFPFGWAMAAFFFDWLTHERDF